MAVVALERDQGSHISLKVSKHEDPMLEELPEKSSHISLKVSKLSCLSVWPRYCLPVPIYP